ncbi:Hsp20/alpha crystallin family protein [Pseudogemmobacter sp. W21_MBD1_M6]|uniref:Hsp20/alpha crystallin family protein n=1 Tax=Pseudogemmobacter sp. W21_MBD1_M6 TaxID=3240271 RepID=UPI003F9D4113
MSKKSTQVEVKRETRPAGNGQRQNPFVSLRHEIDRLFEDFDWPGIHLPFRASGSAIEPVRQWSDVWAMAPAMDLVERNGEYEIQAELPGLGLDDIDVKVSEGMLTIKGEKSEEHVEDDQDYHMRERSYGQFQRSFRLPDGVDTDKVEARFDKGVLFVKMPKTAQAKSKERKIEVKPA